VRLESIQPGKPVQNAYVESFNGRLRVACLNANWFTSLSDARRKIETWRQDYNQQRPHSALDNLPPQNFPVRKRKPGLGEWGSTPRLSLRMNERLTGSKRVKACDGDVTTAISKEHAQ
jgi:hypothetical protein